MYTVEELPNCDCGMYPIMRYSFSSANPGRRFIGCRNYGTKVRHYQFFRWVDDPLPVHIKRPMLILVERLKESEELRKKECLRSSRILCRIVVLFMIVFSFMLFMFVMK